MATVQMEKIQKRRSAVLATVTKLIKELQENGNLPTVEASAKIATLNKLEKTLDELNLSLMDLLIEVPGNDDACAKEVEETSLISEQIALARGIFEKKPTFPVQVEEEQSQQQAPDVKVQALKMEVSVAKSTQRFYDAKRQKLGRPVKIVSINERGKLVLNERVLQWILDSTLNVPVAIYSVAGKARRGKSMLLNFVMRFLHQKCFDGHEQTPECWNSKTLLPDGNSFKSASGTEGVTQGIHMWSKPFFVKNGQNGKVAVLLVDTQGLFDYEKDYKESVMLFGLSLLLSSFSIYYYDLDLKPNDLDDFLKFSLNAKLAFDDSSAKNATVFQNVLFLVRDWSLPNDYSYGLKGGERYLSKVLEGTKSELHKTALTSLFSKKECTLMPHPGEKVATGDFNGTFPEIESKIYQQTLTDLLRKILDPNEIVVKKNAKGDMKGRDILEQFCGHVRKFQSGKLTEMLPALEAMARLKLITIKDEAIKTFVKEMSKQIKPDSKYVTESAFSKIAAEAWKMALDQFEGADCGYECTNQKKLVRDDLKQELRKNENFYAQLNLSHYGFWDKLQFFLECFGFFAMGHWALISRVLGFKKFSGLAAWANKFPDVQKWLKKNASCKFLTDLFTQEGVEMSKEAFKEINDLTSKMRDKTVGLADMMGIIENIREQEPELYKALQPLVPDALSLFANPTSLEIDNFFKKACKSLDELEGDYKELTPILQILPGLVEEVRDDIPVAIKAFQREDSEPGTALIQKIFNYIDNNCELLN